MTRKIKYCAQVLADLPRILKFITYVVYRFNITTMITQLLSVQYRIYLILSVEYGFHFTILSLESNLNQKNCGKSVL